MVIFSAKLTKGKLIAAVLAGGVMLCAAIIAVSMLKGGNAAAAGTEEERMIYIRSFGWEVGDGEDFCEIAIPEEFDDVYKKYNELQIAQGFDLEKYQGKTVEQYTYTITNYPTGENGVLCHMLVYKGKVIGGDVMSPRLDGFMHGFSAEAE